MQGAWNDMLLVPAIAAFPELFPLLRVGMSHGHWLNLFQKWIAPAAVPTTGWVGALRLCPAARPTLKVRWRNRWSTAALLYFVWRRHVWHLSSLELYLNCHPAVRSGAHSQDSPRRSTNFNEFCKGHLQQFGWIIPIRVSLANMAWDVLNFL